MTLAGSSDLSLGEHGEQPHSREGYAEHFSRTLMRQKLHHSDTLQQTDTTFS